MIKRILIYSGTALGLVLIAYLAISHLIYYTAEDRLPTLPAQIDAYLAKKAECERRPANTEPKSAQLDVGPTLHKLGRPASWKSQNIFLGDTCFKASIGPSTYQDETDQEPDYYSIDVEARHVGKTMGEKPEQYWLVYFRRDLEMQELPERFLERKIDDVISFNEETNVVTFEIGKNKYAYQIPTP